jgi:thiamine-phosphate pyrophosphorylase
MNSPAIRCRLYLITPPRIELPTFPDQLANTLDGGDVACLQLRLKETTDDRILEAGHAIRLICHEHDVALLINDRPDLAAEIEADGVHIGQSDASYEDARRSLGANAIVGVTCHASRDLAMAAGEQGADYVAFGAFFPTQTKLAKASADPDILIWWQEVFEIPCVAIGGITIDTCAALARAGADFVAVSSGVWDFGEGPKAAVTAFNRTLNEVYQG